MTSVDARAKADLEPQEWKRMRLRSSVRRDSLLDAAVALLESEDVQAVSMEAVAERAGVSRPLVYKHFANRDELLVEIYRREAASLHEELVSLVSSADGTEEMYRSLVRGAIRAAAERGHLFAVLRSAGGWSREVRSEQRSRDRTTVKAFSVRAEREYGLDRPSAIAATAVLLGSLDSVLTQWRTRPTPQNAQVLEDIYVAMVRAGYAAARPAPEKRRRKS